MPSDPISKYTPFPPVSLPGRKWPDRVLKSAPIWCSVDLRDGNQALAQPMSVEEKLEYFDLLVRIGFKEIEVGFPSASQIEFDFIRRLIDEEADPGRRRGPGPLPVPRGPDHALPGILQGAKNVIFHLYNSTSPKQREYVFNLPKPEIVKIPGPSAAAKREAAPVVAAGTRLRLEYSPESFTSTELDFALEICEAVTRRLAARRRRTRSSSTCRRPSSTRHPTSTPTRSSGCAPPEPPLATIVSLHTHNDRGTGVAATELALLAGADRVEGTLFGNGERTGNLDIVTVALNLYTQGIHPGLDFGDLNAIRDVYERCTRLEVPARLPYAGELVFTAFSGSHQDAIKKSLAQQKPGQPWDVLYIPIDPADIGRSYRAIIRINSQSGKGGVAYILETEHGFQLPKAMHKEIGRVVNDLADARGTELTSSEIRDAFQREYLDRASPVGLEHFKTHRARLDGALRGAGRRPRGGPHPGRRRQRPDRRLRPRPRLDRAAEVRRRELLRAFPRRRGRGQGRELHPGQDRPRSRLLRRRDRHQHRARLDQGDRERAQPGDGQAMRFVPAKRPLAGETLESLTEALGERGQKPFRARQVLEWYYKKRARSWEEMTNLPKDAAGLAR